MTTDSWIADSETSERFPFWTRANVGEIAPAPMSPLNFTLVFDQGATNGYIDGHIRWGSFEAGELTGPNRPFACFGGYLYINWSMLRIQGERSPGLSAAMMDAAFFGDHPDIPPYEPHPDDQRPDLEARIQSTMDWLMSLTELPDELAEDRAKALALREDRPDLAAASDAELVERARAMRPFLQEFFDPYMVYGTMSSMALGLLQQLCADADPALPGRLLSGIGDIDSVPPSQAIWDLSRSVKDSPTLTAEFDQGVDGLLDRLRARDDAGEFLAALDRLRHEHGARGPIEWDIQSPTWETRPDLVLSLVDRLRLAPDDLSPSARHQRAVADRQGAEAELREQLQGDAEALATLDLALRLADVYVPGRERTKLTEMLTVHEVRVVVDELGRRMVERGVADAPQRVTLLVESELDAFVADPDSFRETLRDRHRRLQELGERQEPFIIYGEAPRPDEWPPRSDDVEPLAVGDVLPGVAASPGVVTGPARVVKDPGDPRGLEPGDVLVATVTDPAWTPLFLASAAVIVEIGAPMSHAMIVSRELGLPCVTGVQNASKRITDGMLLQVDGGRGTVTVLDRG